MGEDNVSKIFQEVSALKSIMDDFAKVVASVFNEIKASISSIQASTQAIQSSIQNLNSTLPQQLRDALKEDLSSFKEVIKSIQVGVPASSAFAAPAEGDVGTPGVIHARAGLRGPASAFSPLIEALEMRSTAADIASKLEDVRDTLQSRYPSNPAFYEMTRVAKQLRNKGSAKLDRMATNELIKLAEEWSERIVK
ncbi:MAG: hypothetical protein ACUVXA_07805 [Candidatus Jordarchaeum sp.]|uniref:hypothetical protein n=1 Tax=Candidatus Jordarchaeum sp. TaxID=2823881 RepID=UPI004049C0F1